MGSVPNAFPEPVKGTVGEAQEEESAEDLSGDSGEAEFMRNTKDGRKIILSSVSGQCAPGQLLAIMVRRICYTFPSTTTYASRSLTSSLHVMCCALLAMPCCWNREAVEQVLFSIHSNAERACRRDCVLMS